jgi:hypothetical protein
LDEARRLLEGETQDHLAGLHLRDQVFVGGPRQDNGIATEIAIELGHLQLHAVIDQSAQNLSFIHQTIVSKSSLP